MIFRWNDFGGMIFMHNTHEKNEMPLSPSWITKCGGGWGGGGGGSTLQPVALAIVDHKVDDNDGTEDDHGLEYVVVERERLVDRPGLHTCADQAGTVGLIGPNVSSHCQPPLPTPLPPLPTVISHCSPTARSRCEPPPPATLPRTWGDTSCMQAVTGAVKIQVVILVRFTDTTQVCGIGRTLHNLCVVSDQGLQFNS